MTLSQLPGAAIAARSAPRLHDFREMSRASRVTIEGAVAAPKD